MSTPDITIGIELLLVGRSGETLERLRELTQILRGIQGIVKGLPVPFTDLNRVLIEIGGRKITLAELYDALSMITRTGRRLIPALTSDVANFALTLDTAAESTKALAQTLDSARVEGRLSVEVLRALSLGFRRAGITIPISLLREMDEALGRNSQKLLEWAARYAESERVITRHLREIRDVNRQTIASLGAMGIALTRLGRTFFWAGLGTMFFFMSLARAQRQALNVKSAQLALIRSSIRLQEAQETVRRFQEAGIISGERYREAILRLREAELGLELAQDRLKTAIMTQFYAWLMLAFGSFPTVIRGISDLVFSLIWLFYATKKVEDSTVGAFVKTLLAKTGFDLEKLSVDALNAALFEHVLLLGAATFGVSALAMGIGYLITKMIVAKQLEDLNERLKELGITIAKPYSPSLVEAFQDLAESLDVISTKGRIFSTLARTTFGLRGMTPIGGGVVVNIQGPFYVRAEEDIDRISRAIARRLRGRGVYV